jgi:hypothetical protein
MLYVLRLPAAGVSTAARLGAAVTRLMKVLLQKAFS